MSNLRKDNWYKKHIVAQNAYLNDLVNWVDEDTLDDAANVLGPQVVDFDELERQRAQAEPFEQGELPYFSEEEVGDYLVDDLIEQDERGATNDEVEEGYFDGSYIPSKEELQEKGIEPVRDTGEVVDENPDDVPEFGENRESALRWAIDNNRVVKLSYLTLGKKRGRGGKEYLKREITNDRIPGTGVNIWRVVEPHHIFSANNGHNILVTYDRSVRHIRAFRLDNITDVEFVKKRQTNEPSYFKPRVKIKNPGGFGQSGKIKGIESMNNNIFHNLKDIGDSLEEKGLSKTAGVITATMSNLLNIKTAQYVGPQGYWIRQKRCWDNCYRQKRTTSPEKAAQVVWTECWSEYNEAINNNQSGWEKYAKEDADLFKYASKEQQEWVKTENKRFAKEVEKKIASGESQGTSIYLTLEENKDEYNNMILTDADNLSKIAEKLKENGQDDLSEKVANVSMELLKESQFGGNVGNWGNKLRKLNPFSAKSRAKGLSGDILNRLKNVSLQARRFSEQFNAIKSEALQQGKQFETDQNALDQRGIAQDARNQKIKEMPGKAYNAVKQVGQNIIDPLVNRGPAKGASTYNLKIARQPGNYQEEGVVNFVNNLKQQLQTYLSNLSNEAASMATMSAQAGPDSKQLAVQAYARMNSFVQEANKRLAEMTTFKSAIQASTQLVNDLNIFADEIQAIQTGGYTEQLTPEPPQIDDPIYSDPQADPDKDGFPNEEDGDRNNDNIVDNPNVDPIDNAPVVNVSNILSEIEKNYPDFIPRFQKMNLNGSQWGTIMNLFENNNVPLTKKNFEELRESVKMNANWNTPQSTYGKQNSKIF